MIFVSIIVAFVSEKGGVVGRDGRMFSAAHFDCYGQLDKHAQIERDDFDKTFKIGERIIGAFCGVS